MSAAARLLGPADGHLVTQLLHVAAQLRVADALALGRVLRGPAVDDPAAGVHVLEARPA